MSTILQYLSSKCRIFGQNQPPLLQSWSHSLQVADAYRILCWLTRALLVPGFYDPAQEAEGRICTPGMPSILKSSRRPTRGLQNLENSICSTDAP